MPGPKKVRTPQQLLVLLKPYYRVFKPDGVPPYPTVILLHGARKEPWREDVASTAEFLVEEGFAVVFVDSFKGRGMVINDVYKGRLLPRERAGDLFVTCHWLRTQRWCDPSRIGVWGQSHGATTIMDALILASSEDLPTSLLSLPPLGLSLLKAAVLVYPWCQDRILGHELIKAVENDWSISMPILALIPDKDANAPLCTAILERHKLKGLPVEIVHYREGDHGFDLERYGPNRPNPRYNPKITSDATRRTVLFFHDTLNRNR